MFCLLVLTHRKAWFAKLDRGETYHVVHNFVSRILQKEEGMSNLIKATQTADADNL